MEEQHNPQPEPSITPQTGLLKFLCVLTFIGSGLALFAYFIIGAFYNIFLSADMGALGEDEKELIKMMLSAGRTFFLLSAFLYCISLYGAIMMWKLRKTGFHLYTTAQIILLILPLVFIHGFRMPFATILVTVVFIFGYATFLKSMK
ncbi:MAG TPA: hypothetical protein PLP88_04195 [Bacteroidales bacterium]|nr:hypothetical protein [Bacteroidales bacterium]